MNEQFNTYLQFMKLFFEKLGICSVLCTEDACFAWIVVFYLQKNELSKLGMLRYCGIIVIKKT
jgi:hypothetical protein